MADEPEQVQPAEDGAPSNAELAARVDGLDSKLDKIIGMFGSDTKAHEAAQQHTEDRLDRPSSIADEIRQQLAEQKSRDDAAANAADAASWKQSVDERLAGMAEKTPEAPLRRVEKVMGWR